jgi:hypothetical protein
MSFPYRLMSKQNDSASFRAPEIPETNSEGAILGRRGL